VADVPSLSAMRREIEREFGALPAFFEPAFANPGVLRGLWLQTRLGWVESPVPPAFRRALLGTLARHSPWPWRAVADEADRLPRPAIAEDGGWPAEGEHEYGELLTLTLQLVVGGPDEGVRTRLQALLGWSRYASLIAMLTYLETCRTFAQAHPGLAAAARWRYRGARDPRTVPVFEVDHRGSITSCSPAAEDLFGYPAGAVIGTAFRDLFADEAGHALDRCIAELRSGGDAPVRERSFKLVGQRSDASTFDAVVTVANRSSGGRPGKLTAVVEADALGARNAYRGAYRLLMSMAEGQLGPTRVEPAVAALARTLGWEYMLIWRFDPDEDLLRCVAAHHLAGEPRPEVEKRAEATLRAGDDQVGTTLRTGVPEWDADLGPSSPSAIASALWLPIGSRGEEGVVELLSTNARRPDPALLEVFSTLARGASSAIEPAAGTDADAQGGLARAGLAFEAAPVGMALVSVEPGREGEIIAANRAMAILSGRDERDLVGTRIGDLTYPEDADLDDDLEVQLLAGDIPSYEIEKRFQRADGQLFWGELAVSLIRAEDKTRRPLYVVVQLADVTERKRVEEALHASRDRLASVFEEAPVGMALATLDGRWLQVNEALCQTLGYADADLLDHRLTDVIGPEEAETVERYLRELLTDEVLGYQVETQAVRDDGEVIWVQLSFSMIHDYDGSRAYVFVELQDVSERRRLEEELAQGVLVDAITGLPSRALLFDRLEQARARLERNGVPFAVMFVALDGFAEVSVRLGAEHAEVALKDVAGRLLGAVRAGDTVARYSEAEFVIICEDLESAGEADLIASRIVEARAIRVGDLDDVVQLNLTLGVAVANESSDVTAALVERADAAMHAAIQRGVAYAKDYDSR
jgi:PAS domain S-box-containing protein/diguanylate cyclase (GGDEF)-like protein